MLARIPIEHGDIGIYNRLKLFKRSVLAKKIPPNIIDDIEEIVISNADRYKIFSNNLLDMINRYKELFDPVEDFEDDPFNYILVGYYNTDSNIDPLILNDFLQDASLEKKPYIEQLILFSLSNKEILENVYEDIASLFEDEEYLIYDELKKGTFNLDIDMKNNLSNYTEGEIENINSIKELIQLFRNNIW